VSFVVLNCNICIIFINFSVPRTQSEDAAHSLWSHSVYSSFCWMVLLISNEAILSTVHSAEWFCWFQMNSYHVVVLSYKLIFVFVFSRRRNLLRLGPMNSRRNLHRFVTVCLLGHPTYLSMHLGFTAILSFFFLFFIS